MRSLAEQVRTGLTRDQRIGQLFMVATPVHGVSTAFRAAVRDEHVGNAVLTGQSTKGADHVRSVTMEVQQLTESGDATGGVPAFVAVDHGGGHLGGLLDPGHADLPPAPEEDAEADARRRDRWGALLCRCGVNTVLGRQESGTDEDCTVIGSVLRTRRGFDGIVMTDDVGDSATLEDWAPGERATGFIDAGGDVLLTTSSDTLPQMVAAVRERAGTDPEFATKVDASALRVLEGKEAAGLLRPRTSPTGTYGPKLTTRLQTWLGLAETGDLGPETIGYLQYRIGAPTTGRWDGPSFEALQVYLGLEPDGTTRWDERTTARLQRYLDTQP